MKDSTKMKCSVCHEESDYLSTQVDIAQEQTLFVCTKCMAESSYGNMSLEKVNELLEEYEKLIPEYETRLIKPGAMREPTGERAVHSITLKKMYDWLMTDINYLRIRKLKLESKMPNLDLWRKEMKKAVEVQDFEKAASLKDKIMKCEAELDIDGNSKKKEAEEEVEEQYDTQIENDDNTDSENDDPFELLQEQMSDKNSQLNKMLGKMKDEKTKYLKQNTKSDDSQTKSNEELLSDITKKDKEHQDIIQLIDDEIDKLRKKRIEDGLDEDTDILNDSTEIVHEFMHEVKMVFDREYNYLMENLDNENFDHYKSVINSISKFTEMFSVFIALQIPSVDRIIETCDLLDNFELPVIRHLNKLLSKSFKDKTASNFNEITKRLVHYKTKQYITTTASLENMLSGYEKLKEEENEKMRIYIEKRKIRDAKELERDKKLNTLS